VATPVVFNSPRRRFVDEVEIVFTRIIKNIGKGLVDDLLHVIDVGHAHRVPSFSHAILPCHDSFVERSIRMRWDMCGALGHNESHTPPRIEGSYLPKHLR